MWITEGSGGCIRNNMSIGSNINRIRLEKGISMKNLASAAGVTVSLISQIEHDKANPSINTLLAISTALNTDIRNFFQGYAPAEPAAVVHPQDRVCVGSPAKGWIQQYLTNSDLKKFSVTYNCVAPGASTDKIPEVNNPSQGGYEFGYIIKGELMVKVEKSTYLLKEGDAITFEGEKKHSLTNLSKDATEIVWVVIPGMKE